MATNSKHEKAVRDALLASGYKSCAGCKQTFVISNFGSNLTRKDGLNAYCKSCYFEYNRGWRGKNAVKKKEDNAQWYTDNRERIAEAGRRYREKHWVRNKIKQLRAYCKLRDWDFDLDEHEDMLVERFSSGRCEMTGLLFSKPGGERKWSTPSVDRLDCKQGYIYTNVRFVLWIMNVSMSTWGEDVLAEVMNHWIVKTRPDAL